MYKIKYEYSSREILNNFILSYKKVYEKLYFDSWLFDLDTIIDSYIKKWDNLDIEIRNKIKTTLREDIVPHKLLTTF